MEDGWKVRMNICTALWSFVNFCFLSQSEVSTDNRKVITFFAFQHVRCRCCYRPYLDPLLKKWANLHFIKFFKFFHVQCSKTNSTIRKYCWGGFIPVLPSLASSFTLGLKGLNKNDVHNQGKLEKAFKKSSKVSAKRTGVREMRQAPRPTPAHFVWILPPRSWIEKKMLENKNRGLQTV